MKRIRRSHGWGLAMSVTAALLVAFAFVPGMAAQTPEETPAQTPYETQDDAEQFAARPIPRGFKVAAVLLVLTAAGAGFYFALRTWRYSNLFDRQYVFPPAREATLRLGANRSGGRLATINFTAAPAEPAPVTPQKPEETPPP
jgi:hypothetical protein